ncbi:Gfo/Idh/MocA family oxidoreductase [Verrucomicrobiales bacterium BCK34]|nr:Gfo/Idh/MocA family oxidoreductase [Verrucomicrobiales bacterium BCK34]
MKKRRKKYGWGLIGPGRFAREFVEELRLIPGAELVAVASRSERKAEAFAREFGFQSSYGAYEELVADPDVDIVYIAVPHVFHDEIARLAIGNGKAVFCEKPLTPSLRSTRELLAYAENEGVFLMEGMKTGFLPAIARAKEWIAGGSIGQVKLGYADFCFTGSQDPSDRLLNPELGGGAVLDVGIYPLHLMRLLLGEIETVEATGELASTGVENSVAMIAAHAGGARSCMTCSIQSEESMGARILGTEGEIRIPKFHAATSIELLKGGEVVNRLDDDSGGMVKGEIVAAMAALDEGMIQCPGHSHEDTLALAGLMETVIGKVRGNHRN